MPIEINVMREGISDISQLSDGRQIRLEAETGVKVIVDTMVGRYPTDFGTVVIERISLNHDGLDQHIKINGTIVGREVIMQIDPTTGRGRLPLSPGKILDMYVSEGNQMEGLRSRLILQSFE